MPRYQDLVKRMRPVGYWPLDEIAGNNPMERGVGPPDPNERNGTLAGTVPPVMAASSTLRGRRAPLFSQGYVVVPDNPVFSIGTTGELTVTCWARIDTEDSTGATFVSKRLNTGGSGNLEWIVRQLNAGNNVNVQLNQLDASDLADLTAGSGVQNSPAWWFVAFTAKVSTTNLTLYINGTPVGSDTTWVGSTHNGPAKLCMGWWEGGDVNQQLIGSMAHVAIFSKVLGAGVLRRMWATGRRGPW